MKITFVVKLQMQLQKSAADRQFRGPIDCARQIVRSQGVLGLWTGFTGSLAFRSNFLWMFLSFEVFILLASRNNLSSSSQGFDARVLKIQGDII